MPLTFPLGDGPEFDRVRAIVRALGGSAAQLGDDCALIRVGGETLALSTDVSVEDVHFRIAWLTLEEIGWRAAAGALSDLAAEAAAPIGLLAAVTVPRPASDAEVAAVMAGVGGAAARSGAAVLGGDLSSGAAWAIAVTVIGRTPRPVTRAGAVPGDGVWVTGRLGAARAALEAWRRGVTPPADARAAFARPEPRIDAGDWLARHGAHAMLDLSDGIAGDAGHLAAASGVALEVDLGMLPLAPSVHAAASALGLTPERFAAEAGEDYELLVALPTSFGAADAARFRQDCDLQLTRVGCVAEGAGVRFRLGGEVVPLRGFDHFR